MSPLTAALAGAALLAAPGGRAAASRSWPVPHGWRRGELAGRRATRRRLDTVLRRARPVPAGCAAALAVTPLAGPAVGAAAGVAAGVAAWVWRARAAAVHARREVDALVEAVGALTAELRAGHPPHEALAVAARTSAVDGVDRVDGMDGGGGAGAAGGAPPAPLRGAAAVASLGGDVPAALRASAAGRAPAAAAALGHLAAAWQVSEDGGASLGTVLDRVDADLRARRTCDRQRAAHLAGPRATGAMLAALPAFGVLLGTAMGARPLDTLLHTGTGQVALLLGACLDAAGVVWTARLLDGGGAP